MVSFLLKVSGEPVKRSGTLKGTRSPPHAVDERGALNSIRNNYFFLENLLTFQRKIYIPKKLRSKFFKLYYAKLENRYFDKKIKKRLTTRYYFPKLRKEVTDFITKYNLYYRIKYKKHRPYKILSFFRISFLA